MSGEKINFGLGGSNAAAANNAQNSAGVSNSDESGEKNRKPGKEKGKGTGGQQSKKQGVGRGGGSANARASSYKESAMAFAAAHWPQQLKKRRDNKARKKRSRLENLCGSNNSKHINT